MPITVYGAGAIGGITGAALARAGHDVLLVDSAAAHVLIEIIQDLEEDRRQMDWANLDPLVALASKARS
jgi:ketopantoate reductase